MELLLGRHPDQAAAARVHLARLGIFGSIADSSLAEIGPYRPIRVLGRGGMGEVVLAEQREPVRRTVAVKRIRREAWTPEVRARFEFERQALALLGHDGIAKIFDAGTTVGGDPYFVMEYVDGAPISKYCDAHRLSIRARVGLVLQACDALAHAHQRGVLHRDLKPSNLLVDGDPSAPRLKVIDFGLAKSIGASEVPSPDLTLTGQILGTPEYMSPEQAGGADREVDTLTDVYGLGAILYELAAGVPPHAIGREKGLLALLREIQDGTPKPPSARVLALGKAADQDARSRGCATAERLASELRGDLDWIVLKAINKDKDQRYASVAELGADLRRYRANEPVLAGPASTSYRIKKFVRRNRASVISGAAILTVLLVASPVVAYSFGKASLAEARFDVMGDRAWLAQLQDDAQKRLWPVTPELIPALQSWLKKAKWLLARLPEHERALAEAIAEARSSVTSHRATNPGDYADEVVKSGLQKLVEELKRFGEGFEGNFSCSPRRIASVEKRLEWAQLVAKVTLVDAAGAWNAAISSIGDPKASPHYQGLAMKPLIGFVPLGKDSRSGLWEFRMVTPFGKPPRIESDGHLALEKDSDLVFVLVPGGSISYEYGLGRLKEVGQVDLDPFLIGKHEISQGQWALLTGERHSQLRSVSPADGVHEPDLHPVEQVSFEEGEAVLGYFGLTVPTEAQWVHSARGGTQSPYWPSLDGMTLEGYVNVADQSAARLQARYEKPLFEGKAAPFDDGYPLTAPVDTLKPNPFGLHHMLGNVWEFCADPGASSPPTAVRPGDGLRSHDNVRDHVVRGGSCRGPLERAKVEARLSCPPDGRNAAFGLRAVRRIVIRQ